MSVISMKQLLEAGVHFGHQTKKWNPKMKKYIFTDRNGIHIINLEDTSKQIDKAYLFIKEKVANGASVLFVGTKKQASETAMQEAERAGMYYVNSRWLGGTLTNFSTIRTRIERMNKLNAMEQMGDFELLPKKEVIKLKNERDKLQNNLLGIKDMTTLLGLIIMVDPKNEHIC
ncbi:MAG: 30S ribosomal protein S2, partial [Clostridia bacterium]|nr:30S ribosomal protein S2 [Clostridia bacterium]